MFDNPVGVTGSLGSVLDLAILAAIGAVVLVGCLSVWSLVVRYRRGSADLKRQLRWFAWGSALTLAGGMVLVVTALAAKIDTALTDLSWVIFAIASVTLPIAALIAILRDRLYDIDRLISRTFVYGLLTAILAGLYSALIRLFNSLFVDVTGRFTVFYLVTVVLTVTTQLGWVPPAARAL